MKKLVAYFSASGVTAKKASQLATVAGADIYEIAPAVKYTSDDLNYDNNNSRSILEMRDKDSRPELAESKKDLSAYDMIYIGFPIWSDTAPRIVNSFIESSDFSGKQIILFATSEGSGIDMAFKELQEQYPTLNIIKGTMLNGNVSEDIAK